MAGMAPKIVNRTREKDDLCPVLFSYIILKNLEQEHGGIFSPHGESVFSKEDIKEQPTPRNLSATARRVLQCIHGQLQLLGNIFQLSVLCTAVNVQNKINVLQKVMK